MLLLAAVGCAVEEDGSDDGDAARSRRVHISHKPTSVRGEGMLRAVVA